MVCACSYKPFVVVFESVSNTAQEAANYVIASGNNALAAGPMTINSGISVTVPSGSTLVIA